MTTQEILALFDRMDSGESCEGTAIVVDLDKISAGVVRQKDDSIEQLWSVSLDESTDFLSLLALKVAPDMDSKVFASLVKEQYSNWVPLFKNYYRSRGTREVLLPLTQELTLNCGTVVSEFESIWADKAREVFSQVDGYVNEHNISCPRVIVCGELSEFFPAEYEVLRTFYPMPLSPVLPGYIVAHGSVADMEQQAKELIVDAKKPQKILPHTILLQVIASEPAGAVDLLTLATQGTTYDELSSCNYSEKIFTLTNEPLTLIANNRRYQIKIPASVYGRLGGAQLVQIKLGVSDDKPVLFIKTSLGESQLQLEAEIYGGVSNE